MRTRLVIFLLLLLLSVATLLGALYGDENQQAFAVATTIFHLFLLAAGYALAVRHRELARRREQKAPIPPL